MSVPKKLYDETLGRRYFLWNQDLTKLPQWEIPGYCFGTKQVFVEHYSENYTITVKQDSKERYKDERYLAGCCHLRINDVNEDFYIEYRYSGYITKVEPILMETDSLTREIKPTEQTIMLVFAKQRIENGKPHALSNESRQHLQKMCDFQLRSKKEVPVLLTMCCEAANPIRLSFLVMHFDAKNPCKGYCHFYRDNGDVVDLDKGTSVRPLTNVENEAYFRIDSTGIFMRNSRGCTIGQSDRTNTIQVATYHEERQKDPELKAISIVDTQIDLLESSESMEEEIDTQHAVKKEFTKEVIAMEEELPPRLYPKVSVRLYINHVLRSFYEEDLLVGRELVNIKVKTERDRYDWSD